MTAPQIAFRIAFASVDSVEGIDAVERAEDVLRSERVLAAVRAEGAPQLLVPVTDDGTVVALDAEGRVRVDLSASRLTALFAAVGLTLHVDGDADERGAGGVQDALDEHEEIDAELEQAFGEAFGQLDDAGEVPWPDAEQEASGDPEPVGVTEFSRRGPWAARLTAQLLDTPVDYLEASTWSMYRYRTDRAHGAVSGGPADHPIIEVHVPPHGQARVEVSGVHGRTAMFWPNAERLTRPVLEIDEIALPESAELYRRMLGELDGSREELADLGTEGGVDPDAVRRACLPEALGGVRGADARLQALVVAFGVPEALVTAGLDLSGGGRRFTPRGWPRLAGEMLLGGLVEAAPLVHRDRPLVRFARFLRKRPVVDATLSLAELAVGSSLTGSRHRIARGLGILLVLDAVVDLAIWVIRIRRL
ncbi:hypothetical protein [Microbacterium soli]|uniref:Uncharacterized protein n=1 Tax=Microbacterium soli TaxID=446075 RepID=A0ABP7MUU7_9MICO